jgi:hypothetical protein
LEKDYPWYEVTEDPQLAQGDFILECPVLIPPRNFRHGQQADVEFATYNVVVMSQTCDIVLRKIDLVLVCPTWSLTELKAQLPDLAPIRKLEHIRRGDLPGFHMLAACEIESFECECRVVTFRDVYSVHLDFLQDHVRLSQRRLRLLPPYREHLSQAFARFFMRVGLPVNIPSFTT